MNGCHSLSIENTCRHNCLNFLWPQKNRQMTNKKLNTVICRDVKVTSALPGDQTNTKRRDVKRFKRHRGCRDWSAHTHSEAAVVWWRYCRPTHLSESHPGEPPATCPLHKYVIRTWSGWFSLFASSSSVQMITSPPSFSVPLRVNMRVTRQEPRVADVQVVDGRTVAFPPESAHTCRTVIIYGCAWFVTLVHTGCKRTHWTQIILGAFDLRHFPPRGFSNI